MNYTQLKDHIIAHTDRGDIAGSVDVFIEQAVAEINAGVRSSCMEVRASATVSTQITNLPEDVLSLINVQNNSNSGASMPAISLDAADKMRRDRGGAPGVPLYYSVVRKSIDVCPAPDGAYSIGLTYYQKVPVPSAAEPKNALMTEFPNLFITGTLKYAYDYLKEAEDYASKSNAFSALMAEITRNHERTRFGRGAIKSRRRSYG